MLVEHRLELAELDSHTTHLDLPIDPADVGRSYESIVRVNSQSGKGGIAYLLERDHGIVLPRRMQIEFSAIVQRHTDTSEAEISSSEIWKLFERTYLTCANDTNGVVYLSHSLRAADAGHAIDLDVTLDGQPRKLQGEGSSVLDAAVQALSMPLRIDSHANPAITEPPASRRSFRAFDLTTVCPIVTWPSPATTT